MADADVLLLLSSSLFVGNVCVAGRKGFLDDRTARMDGEEGLGLIREDEATQEWVPSIKGCNAMQRCRNLFIIFFSLIPVPARTLSLSLSSGMPP
jgi:hypothetical protein